MPKHRTGCAALRHHRTGNDRPWQTRPSDHTRFDAHRRFVNGPIQPMQEPGFFARLFGGAR
jgi:hypothetical protein